MTNRQRVIDAIQFKKTDYLPHNVDFTSQEYEAVAKTEGRDFIGRINNHISIVDLTKPQTEVRAGFTRDEYGVVWDKTGADRDIGMPAFYQIKTREDFEAYTFPPVDEAFVREQCERLMAGSPDNFRGAMIGFSLFERLWTLMGMEDSLCNMLTDPELIHDLLSKICERNLAVLDIALTYDFDFFHFGDDWGQQRGLIMGPKLWREFIRPYLGRMYARVKMSGKYLSQHSCGDIREIMEDPYGLGLNIYQTFQPEIYGLDYSEKLRGKIAVWGGISTQHDLPGKSPEEIRQITRDTLLHFRETGGLIASPTHSIPADVPVENVLAMIDVFLHQ